MSLAIDYCWNQGTVFPIHIRGQVIHGVLVGQGTRRSSFVSDVHLKNAC
jgi:hypothetical protein